MSILCTGRERGSTTIPGKRQETEICPNGYNLIWCLVHMQDQAVNFRRLAPQWLYYDDIHRVTTLSIRFHPKKMLQKVEGDALLLTSPGPVTGISSDIFKVTQRHKTWAVNDVNLARYLSILFECDAMALGTGHAHLTRANLPSRISLIQAGFPWSAFTVESLLFMFVSFFSPFCIAALDN